MHIQYYGKSCVKVTTKPMGRGTDDTTLIINPFERTKTMAPPQRSSAQVVIRSVPCDIIPNDTVVDICTPGEYAVRGVQIIGVQTAPTVDATVYMIESESLRVAVVDGSSETPSARAMEVLSGADIVLIGYGDGLLSLDSAASVVRALSPSHVIPLGEESSASVCTAFGGSCHDDAGAKVIIKAADCTTDGMTIHPLSM